MNKPSFEFSLDFNAPRIERLNTIMTSVQFAYTSLVEGDIAEFGIAMGESLTAIAATMQVCEQSFPAHIDKPKRLHGFDTFSGFPRATGLDADLPTVTRGIWGEGKSPSPGLPAIFDMAAKFLPRDSVCLYPGLFSETLSAIQADTKFALVHLDCDFHESTGQVLSHLFERELVADGCTLLFDDYLCNRGSPDMGQRRAWEECKQRFAPRFTDLGFYGRTSWRCLIHTTA